MKSLFIISALCFSVVSFAQTKHSLWTEKERQFLVEGLQSSQSDFLNELTGLTQKQIHFKPDSAKWSIAEVAEHLGIYDELLYWDLLNNQYTPEMPEWVEKVKGVDSVMVAYTTDPIKLKAPFVAQPLGRFETKADLLAYFNRFRNEVINLVKETKADFRLHFIFRSEDAGVWRVRDLQQYTLLWIAHTQRHTNQIKSIKASANYPKQNHR
ncbi:DinB family protein [Larkinella rosea]|uniref:DinB family protein n=1 Tax=Larkinella rosea TaxID=2025312 RepID=A0A3P1BJB1_9BACT|nr:DinB family protein [Larkinella rosea]RRB01095.1 DinB family protein [Larkinella rosea]